MDQVNEADWANAWKAYYKPTKVGQRVVVKPTWEDYAMQDGDLIIELDPEWHLVQVHMRLLVCALEN